MHSRVKTIHTVQISFSFDMTNNDFRSQQEKDTTLNLNTIPSNCKSISSGIRRDYIGKIFVPNADRTKLSSNVHDVCHCGIINFKTD